MAEQPGSEFLLGPRGRNGAAFPFGLRCIILLHVILFGPCWNLWAAADELLWALSRLEPKHIILTIPIDGKHAFRRCLLERQPLLTEMVAMLVIMQRKQRATAI
jgi:hypothetical protein